MDNNFPVTDIYIGTQTHTEDKNHISIPGGQA